MIGSYKLRYTILVFAGLCVVPWSEMSLALLQEIGVIVSFLVENLFKQIDLVAMLLLNFVF